jgi:hypothetical protein
MSSGRLVYIHKYSIVVVGMQTLIINFFSSGCKAQDFHLTRVFEFTIKYKNQDHAIEEHCNFGDCHKLMPYFATVTDLVPRFMLQHWLAYCGVV